MCFVLCGGDAAAGGWLRMVELVIEKGDYEWFIQYVFIPLLLVAAVVVAAVYLLK